MADFDVVTGFSSPTADLDPVVIKNGKRIRQQQ